MTDSNDIFKELDLDVNTEIDTDNYSEIELRTGIDPTFFAETITTDVELIDALFDLIDNSIDAARNIIISNQNHVKDSYGLPSDYSGYKIKIVLSKNKISIADNCLGIDSQVIENQAFYTGKKSHHKFGIGHYGLGLKRALLKSGKSFLFKSDNGENLYVSEFSHDALSGNKEHKLTAKKYKSQGNIGTFFRVTNLKSDAIEQIASQPWSSNLINELCIRYSIFITKGLSISVKNTAMPNKNYIDIVSKLPGFRIDGPLLAFSHPSETHKNVNVFFDIGVHEKYLFPAEYGSNPKNNKKITKEYGIYFIFNDRVIVSSSFHERHGFIASKHAEYHGFVCYVRMISEDPGNLPWNTAKTEVKVHNPVFIAAKKPIEIIASKYRSKAKAIINIWTNEETKNLPDEERRNIFYEKLSINPSDNDKIPSSNTNSAQGTLFAETSTPSTTLNITKPPRKPKPRPPVDLSRDRDIFIDWNVCETEVPESRKKEFHIFAEMCRLSSKDTPIACVVMLRVFLETTVKQAILSMEYDWQTLAKSSVKVSDFLYTHEYISTPVKEIVKQYGNTDGGLFSINNIQSHIHSTKFHPDKSKANNYWDELDPFLAGCWKFIQDKDNER